MAIKLFDAELKVMNVLWRKGATTVKQLAEILNKKFAVCISVFILTLLVGCGNDTNSSEIPDYVHVTEIIEIPLLPDGMEIGGQFVLYEGIAYFTAMDFAMTAHLFSFDIDNMYLMRLPYYVSTPPPDDISFRFSQVVIADIHVDRNGNLWIIESGIFQTIDHPDGVVPEGANPWDYIRVAYEFNMLRKLDADGAELKAINLTELNVRGSLLRPRISSDDAGNIYLLLDSDLFVLDSDGDKLFYLHIQHTFGDFVVLSDGGVAYFQRHAGGAQIRLIDVASESWGEIISLPATPIHGVFSGNNEFLMFFNDTTSLYGIDPETREFVKILDWADNGISSFGMSDIAFLHDMSIVAASHPIGASEADLTVPELVIISQKPSANLPERIPLTLATFNFEGTVQRAVLHFNRTSSTHRIHVVDYSLFNTGNDHLAGLTRLITEIIAGTIPDLLDMTHLPHETFAARGILMNLNPFIDADPLLNRSDLVENVLLADEIDGNLYRISPVFKISTLAGHRGVIGEYEGWTLADFIAVLEANPQADVPLGSHLTNLEFLRLMVAHNLEQYVDFEANTVSFDESGFVELLEFAATFPSEGVDPNSNAYILDRLENMGLGRQIMREVSLDSLHTFQAVTSSFGGNANFIGWPNERTNGNLFDVAGGFAITTTARCEQGAWEFIRNFIMEDFQRENLNFSFHLPINRIVLLEAIEYEIMRESMILAGLLDDDGNFIYIESSVGMSREAADQILTLIDSIHGTIGLNETLWRIISESAGDFFRGFNTAQDAARIIQSRAGIMIAEQG